MYTATYNFDADYDKMLFDDLKSYGYNVNLSENSDKIRIQYFNFRRRLIKPKPRNVRFSKEFSCPSNLQRGLDILVEKICKGEDLYPYLSTKILKIDYNDPLLNDWGIYHLHLGEKLENDRFVERTTLVAFIFFNEDDAYFINIYPHKDSWTNQQMVRIIHDNWPEAISGWKLNGVLGVAHKLTNEEIDLMRKHGVNSAIEIGPGIVYLPLGGGLTAAKTSGEVMMAVNRTYKILNVMKKKVEDDLQKIGQIVHEKTGKNIQELELKLHIEDGYYYVIEQNSNVPIVIGKN